MKKFDYGQSNMTSVGAGTRDLGESNFSDSSNSGLKKTHSKFKMIRKYFLFIFFVTFASVVIISAINYFLPDNTDRFSAKSADINDIEYSDNNDDFSVKLTKTSEWTKDNTYGYILNLTIKNTDASELSDWSVELTFLNDITYSDGWEGSFKCEGKTLQIEPVDYNQSIKPQESVNCGFVINSPTELNLEDVVIDIKDAVFKIK